MNMSSIEWAKENEWLQKVIKEIKKQLDENRDYKENFKKDYIKTQREMWQDIGSVSIINGLDQIVDFMQFIDIMKVQKRRHEITRKFEEKYERMLSSPYFGRIDFLENGEKKAEKCYIGVSSLIDDNCDFLVYDWRAKISSMFYDYEIGDAQYDCPEGTIKGKITLKRQYKINNGKIEYMFDSSLKIDDEVLQNILSKSSDDKMKTIVTTIQKEQNKIIRNEKYKNLIVQGPAGSGKTSIALHRIAYLLYRHRDKINSKNIVIFSPNDIFNDYISNVLPQLGEENMLQTTFKDYMHAALGRGFTKESYCQMMEYILTSKKNDTYKKRINSIKFKTSVEFIDILKRYILYVENKDRSFRDIYFKDRLVISSRDIKELYSNDYVNLPLKRRLQKMKDRIFFLLEPYKKERIEEITNELYEIGGYLDNAEIVERSKSIVEKEMKDIYNEVNRITNFDLVDIYKELFEKLELFYDNSHNENTLDIINEIKTFTLKSLNAKMLHYEDQIPMLYLKGVMGDIPKASEIKYVIIDEAQDYTPLQYEIFLQIFKSANMTILGDIAQSINPFMNVGGYNNILNIFPKENTCIINLTKSYRSTKEITKFSRKILDKDINGEWIERSGEKVSFVKLKTERELKDKILEDIKKYKDKDYKSIGIITRTAKEAKEVYSFLKDKTPTKAILKDDDEYVNGVLVIPSYLAKGLEFDVVLVHNVGKDSYNCGEERLLLYTIITRALHVLNLYYCDDVTPLLKEAMYDTNLAQIIE